MKYLLSLTLIFTSLNASAFYVKCSETIRGDEKLSAIFNDHNGYIWVTVTDKNDGSGAKRARGYCVETGDSYLTTLKCSDVEVKDKKFYVSLSHLEATIYAHGEFAAQLACKGDLRI